MNTKYIGEYMNRRTQISASLSAMTIMALSVALLMISVMPAMAYDHDQTYDANATYFVSEDIRVSGYGVSQNVEIWINTSVTATDGMIRFGYDPNCAKVTSVTKDPSVWPIGMVNYGTPGMVIITFGDTYGYSGATKVADMTIESNSTSNCGTLLAYHSSAYLSGISNVNWADGTFLSGEPMVVDKTVWDGSNWVDTLGPLTSDWIGKDVIFNITVTAGCLDLSGVVVDDVMDPGLQYNNNANPAADSNTTYTANWSFSTILAGNSESIEFNATIVDDGTSDNTATATATVTDLGVEVQSDDTATVTTMPPKPDLIVSDITVNYDASAMVNLAIGPESPGTRTQCNNISVNITELSGLPIGPDFNVKLEINGVEQACSPMQVLGGMAGGSTVTVYCDSSFRPIAGVQYNISATADSGGVIAESDETNNTGWRNLTAITNGYAGNGWQDGRNISALQCHEMGPINLTYSHGDSYYVSGYYTKWDTYTVNWTQNDLNIPPTDTGIKKARLYAYYHADQYGDKWANLSLTFNTVGMSEVAHYSDGKGFGSWDYSSDVGVLVYDVTDEFVIGDNTALVTNSNPATPKGITMEAMVLVVVYENDNEPNRIIWINEGCDLISSKYAKYGVSPEEATTYAAFEGCEPIPLDDVFDAKLITIAQLGNQGGVLNRLYFNGGEWAGLFPTGYITGTNIGIHEADVTPYLTETDNVATYQDNGDMFAPANSFLVIQEKGIEMSAEPESDECYDVGEQFDVLIKINQFGAPIMGAQFDLHFNESVLHAETVTYGDFLTGEGSVFVSHSDIDNANGIVSFAAARQGTDIGVTTPGTFAIVHFTAVMQGETSELDLVNTLASDNSTPVETIDAEPINGTVEVCTNAPPVPVAWSNFTYNNIAEKGLSKAYFIGTDSYDDDGTLTNHRWWVDDGSSIVGEIAEHLFVVPMYWQGGSDGYYALANVTLTVTDDGMPLMDANDTMEVIVYIAGDATGDGRVNIADGVTFGMQFGKSGINIGDPDKLCWEGVPEGDKADLNNDGRVNIGDAMLLGTCWGHTAW